MKEIGGYFGLEELISNEYYKDLIPLNNGRNSLLYLLKARKIKKLYIPYYLCNSVSDMLNIYGYNFEYYNINSNFMPIFNKTLNSDEYLYIVNCYGQLNDDIIIQLKQKYGQIILDNTHAFFQSPIIGIDTIYSCRKFFGVPDGAYLSTDVKVEENLEIDISKDRMSHILGRYEGIASEYYDNFKDNDNTLKNESLKFMSKLTHNILGAIDYGRVRRIRNENYIYLHNELGMYNNLKLKTSSDAFSYPFYIENGIKIRKKLAKKKLYIPTLWENVLESTQKDSIEYKYAANILPLPCDQRYDLKDMEYMLELILKEI